jgi:hypothetical protein
MRVIILSIPDNLYRALVKTFRPEEIDVFINQAIQRQLEELYLQTGKNWLKESESQEDENSHEWTR